MVIKIKYKLQYLGEKDDNYRLVKVEWLFLENVICAKNKIKLKPKL